MCLSRYLSLSLFLSLSVSLSISLSFSSSLSFFNSPYVYPALLLPFPSLHSLTFLITHTFSVSLFLLLALPLTLSLAISISLSISLRLFFFLPLFPSLSLSFFLSLSLSFSLSLSLPLSQVCLLDSNRYLFGQAGGCECLVTLLKLHSANVSVCHQGCMAIAGLAKHNLENSTKLGN